MKKYLIVLMTFLIFSCDHFIEVPKVKKDVNLIVVEKPIADVKEVYGATIVSVHTDQDEVILFYTLDGTDPSISNYVDYNKIKLDIVISAPTVLKYVGYKNGYYSSIESLEIKNE